MHWKSNCMTVCSCISSHHTYYANIIYCISIKALKHKIKDLDVKISLFKYETILNHKK